MFKPFANIRLRIVAILMGLLLWFHVATEKTYNHQIQLPVNEIALNENLALASNPPDSITVIVSATGKQLLRSSWRNAGLRINAVQYRPGRYNIDLNASNTSLEAAGTPVSLDEVLAPTSFLLHVDYLDESDIPVNPDLIVTPDDGFAVKTVRKPVPSEVTIDGARSVLRKISEVTTEQKEVSGLRNSITLTLAVKKPEAYGINIDPDSVKVNIEVVPVKTRLFEGIPIVVYNSPTGKTVKTNPEYIDVEMTGPPDKINLLNRNALIASVDYKQLTPNDSVPIKIECPSNFKVKRSSAQLVQLSVQ